MTTISSGFSEIPIDSQVFSTSNQESSLHCVQESQAFDAATSAEETQFQERVQKLQALAQELLQKLSSTLTEPLKNSTEIAQEVAEFFKNTLAYSEEVKLNEEAQGIFYYWRSQLGFGEHEVIQSQLKTLSEKVCQKWKEYLKHCQKMVDDIFTQGDMVQAIHLYRKLHQLAPKKDGYSERIADCYLEIGDVEKAQKYYDTLLSSEKRVVRCSFKKVQCLLELGKTDEALKFLTVGNRSLEEKDEKVRQGKIVESLIKSGKFVDAIHLSLILIERFPGEDSFKLQLIDAYLGIAQENQNTLQQNFVFLAQHFASQSRFSQTGRNPSDAFQITLDFLDYCAKRSTHIFDLYQNFLVRTSLKEQWIKQVYDTLLLRLQFLTTKKEELIQTADRLHKILETSSFENEDEVQKTRNDLQKLSQEITGGRKAEVRQGMLAYTRFYIDIIEGCFRKIEQSGTDSVVFRYKEKFEELVLRGDYLHLHFHELYRVAFQEGDMGIRQLFQTRLRQWQQRNQSENSTQNDDEDLSSIEWIKRGNLVNFIRDVFVPEDQQDHFFEYLGSYDIEQESLFETDLMDFVKGEGVIASSAQTALQDTIKSRNIHSISDLKQYIYNPNFKRQPYGNTSS